MGIEYFISGEVGFIGYILHTTQVKSHLKVVVDEDTILDLSLLLKSSICLLDRSIIASQILLRIM